MSEHAAGKLVNMDTISRGGDVSADGEKCMYRQVREKWLKQSDYCILKCL